MDTAEWTEAEGITAEAVPAPTNPNAEDFGPDAHHWLVTLHRNPGETFQVPFSQGSALTEPPTAADVLDCLASDCAGELDSFEAWAGDLGFDPDSRKAERTWNIVRAQAQALEAFLGAEAYGELLYKVDRL